MTFSDMVSKVTSAVTSCSGNPDAMEKLLGGLHQLSSLYQYAAVQELLVTSYGLSPKEAWEMAPVIVKRREKLLGDYFGQMEQQAIWEETGLRI